MIQPWFKLSQLISMENSPRFNFCYFISKESVSWNLQRVSIEAVSCRMKSKHLNITSFFFCLAQALTHVQSCWIGKKVGIFFGRTNQP